MPDLARFGGSRQMVSNKREFRPMPIFPRRYRFRHLAAADMLTGSIAKPPCANHIIGPPAAFASFAPSLENPLLKTKCRGRLRRTAEQRDLIQVKLSEATGACSVARKMAEEVLIWIEKTQAALRESIEKAKALAADSDRLIRRHRDKRVEPRPASPAR